jgi:hypothetical protein
MMAETPPPTPEATAKTDTCPYCGDVLLPKATLCKLCKNHVNGPPCAICQVPIWPNSKRCNTCGTYQNRLLRKLPFSQVVLALLIALLAVISPAITALLYAYNYYSHIAFTVAGADNNRIYIKVWNTGRQPSVVTDCTLRATSQTSISIPALILDPSDRGSEKNVISSSNPVTLALINDTPGWLSNPGHVEGFTRQQFDRMKNDQLTMTVVSVESNSRKTIMTETFPAGRIRDFLCGECKNENQ